MSPPISEWEQKLNASSDKKKLELDAQNYTLDFEM
jgi:hypothetical protein